MTRQGFIRAHLRVTPSCGVGPSHTDYRLVERDGRYQIAVETSDFMGTRKRRRQVTPSVAASHLSLLQRAQVPAWPVSPEVMDGAFYELTIHGEFASLTLSWWTLPPEGAEALWHFAQWLEGGRARRPSDVD